MKRKRAEFEELHREEDADIDQFTFEEDFNQLVAGEDDLLLHTALQYLDNRTLATCSLTSKRFCTVARRCMDPAMNRERSII